MNILVIHCHTDNRGDEAAIHALVDVLYEVDKNVKITLALRGAGTPYPNFPDNVQMFTQFSPQSFRSIISHQLAVWTKGKIVISKGEQELVNAVRQADLILHAPGGPSIGDRYFFDEPSYLRIFDLIRSMNKPYMFYAPSMGPFLRTERNPWRKKILSSAQAVVLRDPISVAYVKELLPQKDVILTLDSALQYDIPAEEYCVKLVENVLLSSFLKKHKKCVGVTITDLAWHPEYKSNDKVRKTIQNSFSSFLNELVEDDYGVIMIPQLYGRGNDVKMMGEYVTDLDHFFVLPGDDTKYDAYFQQFLISKLYAVVGMRYHSNIFSAKMGIPFISVSYEDKMRGFMKRLNLEKYCIDLQELSSEVLSERFHSLCENYAWYCDYLGYEHVQMKKDSYRSTEILLEIMKRTEGK